MKAHLVDSLPDEKVAKSECLKLISKLGGWKREDKTEEARKKRWRDLQKQYHPDKSQLDSEVATDVFQFLQARKEWFMEE